MKAIGLAAAMLMISAGGAQAESWRMAGGGQTGVIGIELDHLIDRGREKLVWTLVVSARSIGGVAFIKRRIRVDCEDQTYTELAKSGFDEEGRSLIVLDPDPAVRSYTPGSIAWEEFEAICRGNWTYGEDTFQSATDFYRFGTIFIEVATENRAGDRP